jgi:RNA polymerase sigma factor (sigma-70 family)
MDKDGINIVFKFFTEERKKLNSYVHRKIQSISDMDAEGIIEDVMLNIFNKADISVHIGNLAAYVYRSLHNRIIDVQRKNFRTVSLQSYIDEEEEISLLEILADTSSNICSESEKKEFWRRLGEAISKLEPRQRAIFIATEVKGQTFRELSEMWKEPIGTLLSRKSRAMKALQEMLKDLKI